MSKNIQFLLRSISSIAFIIIAIDSYVIVAQTITTGDWKAQYKPEKNGKIYLSFERRTEKGGKNQMGSNYSVSDLQGLTNAQLTPTDTTVKISLVREAGTIDCDGKFSNGKGTGTFRFTANQSFISAMKDRGFVFDKESSTDKHENKLFAAATLNLTTAFTDDLLSAKFGKLDIEDLFKAVIFKVTPQFMQEMASVGFPNLDMEDLVKARIFKIDAEYVRQVKAMGFENEDMEAIVKLRIFKVTPEFIREVQSEGLTNLSVEDATKLRIFKIDADFIRRARSENVPVNVEDLVKKRIGVWGK